MTAPCTHDPPMNKDRTPTRIPQPKPSRQKPRPETQQRRHRCKRQTTRHTPGDQPRPAPRRGPIGPTRYQRLLSPMSGNGHNPRPRPGKPDRIKKKKKKKKKTKKTTSKQGGTRKEQT